MSGSAPVASAAALASQLGAIKRPGGSLQVAYAGHLLYTCALERRPDEVLGTAPVLRCTLVGFGSQRISHAFRVSDAPAPGLSGFFQPESSLLACCFFSSPSRPADLSPLALGPRCPDALIYPRAISGAILAKPVKAPPPRDTGEY